MSFASVAIIVCMSTSGKVNTLLKAVLELDLELVATLRRSFSMIKIHVPTSAIFHVQN